MKTKIILLMLAANLQCFRNAHAQTWNLNGNTNLTSTSKIGGTSATSAQNFPLRLYTYNAERIHINANTSGKVGFVGIGTTAPNTRLHVNGVITATNGTSTTWNFASRIAGAFTTDYIPRWNGTAFVNSSIYDNGANIGIGTAPSSSYKVDVTSALLRTANFNNTLTGTDGIGVVGTCTVTPYFGFGVKGYGGYIGVYGNAILAGTGTRYGVYGYAAGGTINNWAVYASGATFSTGGYNSSDAKLKKDVRPLENTMEKINHLKPRTYTFKSDEYPYMGLPTEQQYGFIAQELETVFPELVRNVEQPIDHDKKNGILEFKAINYTELIPVLTQAIQELDKRNEELRVTNAELKAANATLENKISQIQSVLTQDQQQRLSELQNAKASLEQNIPNPFNKSTVIKHFIPENFNDAQLKIYSSQGVEMKAYTIKQSGKGELTVEANTLVAGIYTYTLIVDGNAADVKQMIVTK